MIDFIDRLYEMPSPIKIDIPYAEVQVEIPTLPWMPRKFRTETRHPFDMPMVEMQSRMGTNNDLTDLRNALNNFLVKVKQRDNHFDKETLTLEITERGLRYIGRHNKRAS